MSVNSFAEKKKRNFPVLTIYFILGFSSIIIQAMLIREFLVVFYGNELVLGTIFGAWFLWIAVGAKVGSYLSAKLRRQRSVFHLSILTGFLLLPLQIYFIRIVRLLLDIPVGQYIPFVSMLCFSVLIIAPFSFIVGFTFPLGCRLFSIGKAESAIAIGWVYIVEALGSLFGGVVFTFVLIARFNSFTISAVLLILFLAVSPVILDSLRRKISILAAYLTGVLIIAAVVFSSSNRVDELTVQQRWKSLGGSSHLEASTDSKYENLVVSRISDQFSIYGNGHFSFTFPDEYFYAGAANFVLTQHPNPKRILIIGAGLGGLLRAMLKNPVERIDYVQLDRKLTELIYPYLPAEDKQALQDERVRIFYTDGRFFLKNSSEKYDIVFLNLPDPATAMLNRYYTLEFFQEVNRTIRDGGVLALYLTSSENYFGEEMGNYAASVFHTLRRVFPEVVVSAGDRQYFFASPQPGIVTTNLETLAQRFLSRNVETKYFSQYNFIQIFLPERVDFIRRALMKRNRVRINTDLKPVTYFYNLLLWDRFAGGLRKPGTSVATAFTRLKDIKFHWIILAIVCFVILRFAYLFLRRQTHLTEQRFNSLFAVASCGLAAMGFEIILLFGYQNLFGYLYQMIALVVAAFMFGLAMGSLGTNLFLGKIRNGIKAFIVLEIVVVLFALCLPFLLALFSHKIVYEIPSLMSQLLFLSLILFAGILTGTGFPLAGKLYFEGSGNISRTAGAIDSADHFGAFVGAFLTGTILLPVLGTKLSAWFVAALNGACILLWGWLLIRKRFTSK